MIIVTEFIIKKSGIISFKEHQIDRPKLHSGYATKNAVSMNLISIEITSKIC